MRGTINPKLKSLSLIRARTWPSRYRLDAALTRCELRMRRHQREVCDALPHRQHRPKDDSHDRRRHAERLCRRSAKLQSAQAHAMVPKLAATLRFCREKGIRVVYTAHVHRRDGSDMGLYDDLYSVVADRSVLVDGSPGAEIYKDLAPGPGEHIIKKHRYSAFFATDLDLILREWGV